VLRRAKHSTIEIVAIKEEEDVEMTKTDCATRGSGKPQTDCQGKIRARKGWD
jgi:hypothetical protein